MSTNPFPPPPPSWPQFNPFAERVGFGQRMVAYIIDALATILFSVLLTFVLMNTNVGSTPTAQEVTESVVDLYEMLGIPQDITDFAVKFLPAMMLASVIGAVAYSLIEGLTGASPGKRAMGIRIRNADGSQPTSGTLLARWSIKNISAILSFVALAPTIAFVGTLGSFLGFAVFVGCFFALSDKRQALHDMIAQTAVFRKNS